MNRYNNFGPRSYVAVTDPGGGRGSGGGGRGGGGGGRGSVRGNQERGNGPEVGDQQNVRQRNIEAINAQAEDLQEMAMRKKAFLQLKWDLKSHRKQLGEGNQVIIVVNNESQRNINIEKHEVNKMLRVAGFTTNDVEATTLSDYDSNHVEVLFREGLDLDLLDMESKMNTNGFDVTVSRFDKIEEFLTIYGLPLTNNVEYVKTLISESIKPFVNEVLEVKPLVHLNELGDDFFSGKRNGNWRVKMVPKLGRQVPNYIVVGNEEKVMGKAVYSKASGDKLEMCSDCFSTEHFKRDPSCNGPLKWSVYCEQFKEAWEMLFVEQEQLNAGLNSEKGESRVFTLEKALAAKMIDVEKKGEELCVKIREQEAPQRKIEELSKIVSESGIKNNDLQNRLANANLVLVGIEEERKRHKDLEERFEVVMKNNEDLVKKALDDQKLMEKSFSRFENVTIRTAGLAGPPGPPGPPGCVPAVPPNEEVVPVVMENGSSPPFYGFPEIDESGLSKKLDEKILDMENSSSDLPDGDKPPDEDAVAGNRKREGEDLSPTSSKVTKSDNHPTIGSKIIIETLKGKAEYYVDSGKNNKNEDFSYILINNEGKKTSFGLKGMSWEYLNGVDPLSPPKE